MRYTERSEIVDPAFKLLILPNEHAEPLYIRGRLLERPVHVPAAPPSALLRYPKNRVLRYDGVAATVATFEALTDFAHTPDHEGRAPSCEP